MKRILSLLVVVWLSAGAFAQERVNLTAPETKPSNTAYHIARLTLDWDGARIDIVLVGVNGEQNTITYNAVAATNLMIALNKANLTTRSLNQRIFDKLIADGFLAGTVAGAVQ